MPYIKQARRDELAHGLERILNLIKRDTFLSTGDLNYIITRIIVAYLRSHPLSYHLLNSIVGVLECAKTEFERRVVEPYEREKLRDNGDVY